MARIEIRCPTTNKIAYGCEETATEAMAHAARRPRSESHFGSRIPTRVYRCEFCTWWHMTAQPKKEATAA